ncbi:sulfate ABC transporter permease subunit CysT [Clostridium kluyveri]|uniref:sulfate ABC transporter permease subunit CysT n=1 Tax=Clostridium kluyveri TaxID=1534 RepID=UPI002247981E|nr:sulfate ABC transporter permease subunit CysT [Clostridium kluyveri]UZQ51541.1 sulfate ABC transporter permease subunit CysT [Clostridium kluyveri]
MTKKTRVIPGFNVSMGLAILYLSLIVLIPLSTILIQTSKMGFDDFIRTVTNPRVIASYKISFGCAFIAAGINAVFGLIISWVLVRYDFRFKRFLDGCIDLPFALPTAVAGISLTTLYSKNGWIGSILAKFGIQGSFSTFGITVALIFIGIPFVVRTVQPVLEDLNVSIEEAASILGASRIQIFFKVIFPQLIAPLLTGFSLAFARGIGEYGSVVFIAGNKPMKTEIAPLLIMTKLEQFDYSGATAIALVMLVFSFFMLFIINLIQWRANKYA